MRFAKARAILQQAIDARAFPAAVVEVGTASTVTWREAFGRHTHDADAPQTSDDTIFDLASLTKVLATTPLVMQQVERGALALDSRIGTRLSAWRGSDRDPVSIRDLLAHCSGLPAYTPLFREGPGRALFEHAICAQPLQYTPASASVYSDLGFMLLGFIVEDTGGATLSDGFDALAQQMGIVDPLRFNPPPQWRPRTAPTEHDPWRGRLLVGEVHDENAGALGGVAGHAGLFGTAGAVGATARHMLQVLDGRTGALTPATTATFISRRTDVPGSSRALGWDTMLPTSSCGRRLSPRAFGHTGFTGTSLWIDPDLGIYLVLLTNRVHPTRENQAINAVRPLFHEAVVEALTA